MGFFGKLKERFSVRRNAAHKQPEAIGERFRELAESFAESTGEPGFDFSLESLALADEWLEHAGDEGLDEEKISTFTMLLGSYVFEVARRQWGGEYAWSEEYRQPVLVIGRPGFEAAIMALDKVERRILNGSEDSIPFYIDGLAAAVQRRESALIV